VNKFDISFCNIYLILQLKPRSQKYINSYTGLRSVVKRSKEKG